MFKFHLLRSSRELIGHLILIFLPIFLISLFNYINKTQHAYLGMELSQITTILTIGFALTFQIFGSAISFETLGQDFLTPMHDRLLATPINSRKIVLSVIFTGIIVSFLQTLLIILFSMIVLNAKFNNLILILIVMLISVVFNQLFGTVILFAVKKVNTATAITSLYGVVVPMLSGLYFQLPDNRILNLFRDYLTPMSLANTAIFGVINEDIKNIIIGVTSLLILIVILYISIKPLSKKVIL